MRFFMNTSWFLFEKSVYGIFFLMFTFVMVYVPLPHTTPIAEAGSVAGTGGSLEVTQVVGVAKQAATAAQTTVSAAANTATAASTAGQFTISNVLNGIAWGVAKNIVSQMAASIINWVNSGFKGSPSFLTNFEGMLNEAADVAVGEYLRSLAGEYSFICQPFKLDVRLALAVTYDEARAKGLDPNACRLSGILNNLENFVEGTEKFVESGGWQNWFNVTMSPDKYTPFGSTLTAKASARIALVDAKGKAIKELDWGDGFLSSKICETVHGATSTRARPENCFISTPGKVINEALTFQTSAGPRSLIEADQINEIISAVFGQLAKQAITGAKGLLGLSGGTGAGYGTTPLTEQLATSPLTRNPELIRELLLKSQDDARNVEDLTVVYLPIFREKSADTSIGFEKASQVRQAVDEIEALQSELSITLSTLDDLLLRYDEIITADGNVRPAELQDLMDTYNNLKLFPAQEFMRYQTIWGSLLDESERPDTNPGYYDDIGGESSDPDENPDTDPDPGPIE